MHGTVEQVERLTPSMVRVVLGGDGRDGYESTPWTDACVKLLFVPLDAPYSAPFDVDEARSLDRGLLPVPRRFSVRAWDEASRRLTIDFVVHGDEGTAAARRAGRPAAARRPEQRVPARGRGRAAGVRAFVHGEAVETRAVGKHLLAERGIPREALSVSPYSRRTLSAQTWREIERDWLAEVEQDA